MYFSEKRVYFFRWTNYQIMSDCQRGRHWQRKNSSLSGLRVHIAMIIFVPE
jgi:hypothetical protein